MEAFSVTVGPQVEPLCPVISATCVFQGEAGVCKVLQILKDELKLAMMLSGITIQENLACHVCSTGCRTLSEIVRIFHESYNKRARL